MTTFFTRWLKNDWLRWLTLSWLKNDSVHKLTRDIFTDLLKIFLWTEAKEWKKMYLQWRSY